MALKKLLRTKETFMAKMITRDPKTLEGYTHTLQNFENYCMEKTGKVDCIEDLKKFDETDLFEFLQGWINQNHDRAPRTVKNYFSQVKKYLHYRGIKLHPQDIKEELDFRRNMQEDLYGLSLEDIQTILKPLRYKHRVQFLCQLSGLMRVGETVQLRKKHLDGSGLNIIVKIPPTIAKFKKGRTTFFSKEASRLLRPILRKLDDDDLVFGTNENHIFSELNVEQIMRRTLKKVGLDMRYESNNRFMINTHSFRAYGITKVSRHDSNFAKKLAGQKGYLDEYDRMTDAEKLELYQKIESDLTIDDTAKLKAENDKLQEERKEIDELREMANMDRKLIEKLMERLDLKLDKKE
ncbi:hypothetical protein C5F47_04290 [Nitrosopumilus cobalaminigenes]|uniref:Tyr recombinase domain-containing protein n=1 Tax=Nitrosopumilus cobalaminigenes TaxID=1470066 RepID=A0A7D5LZ90_9ARCH|nr:tyrosine-type recombinase/integrase [Nitrosopumilus cobalaminigenes]QLH02826.1 hypothetical protein C5F47_04290 [Nitrosopumilus cobalaminigenes]